MLRSVKYGLYGAVLAGLVAAPVVWNSVDKSVHLVVDGKSSTVQTTATDVSQVLHGKGYRVSSHDLVAPSAHAAVHNGMQIVLRRGRLLHLNINGRRTDIWTTAPTVQAALAQLGYTTSDFVSVSRARRLPLAPTDIAIRTPKQVTVVHDGRRESATTTDSTVAQLFKDLDITVGPEDRLSVTPAATLVNGEKIVLQRVLTKRVVAHRTMKFPTARRNDPRLTKGHTKIVTTGRNGRAALTYSVVYVDGREVGRTLLTTTTLTPPRAKVVQVGTKAPKIAAAPAVTASGGGSGSGPITADPSPGSAKAIAKQLLAARGWGQDQYECLVTMWNHESGWRVNADNPGSGAYGIPQALPGAKMASAGPDWQSNAETQIKWGLKYIAGRYHDPCEAWATWQAHGGWY